MNKPLCAAPFIGMYLRHQRNDNNTAISSPCCEFRSEFSYSLKNNNINEYWHSKELKEIRKDMLEGKFHAGCTVCKKATEMGTEPDLVGFNNWAMHETNFSIDTGTSLDTPYIIDIRPNNLCNLACKTCDPGNSSVHENYAEHFDQVKKIFYYNKNDKSLRKDYDVPIDFKEVRSLRLLGGEPLINRKIINMLEDIVNSGYSKNIHLNVTTNGTIVNQKYIDLLNAFRTVKISVSIDGINDTFN